MKDNLARIAVGLLAVFLVGRMGNYILPVFEPNPDDLMADMWSYIALVTARSSVLVFIATAAGGYIARKGFVAPAVIYTAAQGLYGAYLGHATSSNLWVTLLVTLPFLLIAMTVAVAGSIIGMKLYDSVDSRRAEAQ